MGEPKRMRLYFMGFDNETVAKSVLAELKAGKTELELGNTDALDTHVTSTLLKDVQQAGPDEAPPSYRPLVSEYFKKLNESF